MTRGALLAGLTLAAGTTVVGSAAVASTRGHKPAAKPRPGVLISGFGHGGVATLPSGTRLSGVIAQPDGRIVAVGQTGGRTNTRVLVARFTAAGSLDRRFGHNGTVTGPLVRTARGTGSLARAVALAPGGKIVVVGKATGVDGTARDGLLVERYTAGGALDHSFGTGGVVNLLPTTFGDGYAVTLGPGGSVLAAGSEDALGSGNGSYPRALVVRLTPKGSLDPSFGNGGIDLQDFGPFSVIQAIAVSGNKVLIAGSTAPGLQVTRALLARLTSWGALDAGFATSGAFVHQYASHASFSSFDALAVDRYGRVLAGGAATASGSSALGIVTRFTGRGTPDGSFGSAGTATVTSATHFLASGAIPGVSALALGSAGSVLAAGQQVDSSLSRPALWKFTAAGRLAGGFGGHGAATLSLPNGVIGQGLALALRRDGSIVAAGVESVLGRRFAGLLAAFGS